jgi:hypothetical protein
MNELVTPISYGTFMIATTLFMRRAGYSWLAAALAGFFSPLAFIVLFAALLFPFSLLVGKFGGTSEEGHNLLSACTAYGIVLVWCICGFLLSRRAARRRQPQSND